MTEGVKTVLTRIRFLTWRSSLVVYEIRTEVKASPHSTFIRLLAQVNVLMLG